AQGFREAEGRVRQQPAAGARAAAPELLPAPAEHQGGHPQLPRAAREGDAVSDNSILVVGSVALDTVQTPAGEGRESLGGSAVYFSLASSLFVPVSVVGVVGEDFPEPHRALLRQRRIDIT